MSLLESLSAYQIIGGAVILTFTGYMLKRNRSTPIKSRSGVVTVHEIPRRGPIPSFSPFALKLETFLRMAKIPYQVDHSDQVSNKGKIPWIEIDGEVVPDSTFCIEYLTQKFAVQLDSHLCKEDKAIARCIWKMIEENTFWATVVQDRTINHVDAFMKICKVPFVLIILIKLTSIPRLKKLMYGHGIGRHSQDEIQHIGQQDLQALSTILGTKPFFLGDNATTVDAAIFGILANLTHCIPEEAWSYKLLKSDLKNLCNFVERMKSIYWPDWNELIQGKPNTNIFCS